MSDSSELHIVDGDKSTSDKDVLDEVEVFLKAYSQGPGTANTDSAAADPSTPQKNSSKAPKVSVNQAIAAPIFRKPETPHRRRNPTVVRPESRPDAKEVLPRARCRLRVVPSRPPEGG